MLGLEVPTVKFVKELSGIFRPMRELTIKRQFIQLDATAKGSNEEN